MAKVIENLLNAIVHLDDGKIRLMPRGEEDSSMPITDEQAERTDVQKARGFKRIKLREATQKEVKAKAEAKVEVKAEAKVEAKAAPAPAPKKEEKKDEGEPKGKANRGKK